MAAKPRVKFISTDYLKQNTAINENVDGDILVPYIIKAQETHIQQILGSSFYDHLANAIVNSTLTSTEEDLLRNYIQNTTAEWTLYEVLPHLNYKLTNKSVSQQNSEFGNPSTLDDIKYLRSSVRDLAEFYTSRLSKYLCDNSSDFPEYTSPDTPENLPKNSKSYFSGVFLPKSGCNGCSDNNP